MKILFALLLSSCAMNKDTSFYQKITNDFDRYSYFVSIELRSSNYNGIIIIENDDLFNYLQTTQKIDKEKYKEMIKEKLVNHSSLEITNTTKFNFIEVKEIQTVNVNAKKGVDEFIKKYFDNGKVLKDGITDDERTAIIQKLFEWKIPTKIDDETGYLVMSR